jgi:hypothetical protein
VNLITALHRTLVVVRKYEDIYHFERGEDAPYATYQHEGNLLTSGGVTAIWQLVTAAAGGATAFSSAFAYVGIGDSSTAAASGQTDLLGSNKLRKALAAGSPGIATVTCSWTSLFLASEGNYAWNEFAVFNASSGGTMLNRGTFSGGTKPNGQVWSAIVSVSLG